MITRLVSVKQFRDNFSKFLRESQEKKVHFVIMRHAEPIARVTPLTKKPQTLEALEKELAEARKQADRGEVFTQEEMEEMLGM